MNPETDYNLQLIKAKMGQASELKARSRPLVGQVRGARPTTRRSGRPRWISSPCSWGRCTRPCASRRWAPTSREMSSGREIFTEMLDQEYARMDSKNPAVAGPTGLQKAASGTSNSLAAQVYRSLLRQDGRDPVRSGRPQPDFLQRRLCGGPKGLGGLGVQGGQRSQSGDKPGASKPLRFPGPCWIRSSTWLPRPTASPGTSSRASSARKAATATWPCLPPAPRASCSSWTPRPPTWA